MFIPGAEQTPYFDGATDPSSMGYAWTATAENSPSIRYGLSGAGGVYLVRYPDETEISASAGAISAWVRPDADDTWGGQILQWGNWVEGGFDLRITGGASERLELNYYSAGDLRWSLPGAGSSTNQWAHIVASWDSSNVTFYFNGTSSGALSTSIPSSLC